MKDAPTAFLRAGLLAALCLSAACATRPSTATASADTATPASMRAGRTRANWCW